MLSKELIDITGANLTDLIMVVYSLSVPQGLGYLHYETNNITNKEAAEIIEHFKARDLMHGYRCILHIDYLKGRSCKFYVFERDGKRYINRRWYDHTDQQLKSLLKAVGVNVEV